MYQVIYDFVLRFKMPIIFGILITIIGTVNSMIVNKVSGIEIPPATNSWKKNLTMEIIFFTTGVILAYTVLLLDRFDFTLT